MKTVTTTPAVPSVLSLNSQAQRTDINNVSQPVTAESTLFKGDNALQPKKRKPRPTKAGRARKKAEAVATEVPSRKTTTLAASPSMTSSVKPTLPQLAQCETVSSNLAAAQSVHPLPKARSWKTSWMFWDTTGLPLRTIEARSLEPDSIQVSSECGFETLCSYNWQNNGAIYVPGGPPRWNPPTLPTSLAQDTGRQFIDQNAFRVPKFPFEPAFAALAVMKPNTLLDEVDIIVNRNSLRKLLDFSAGKNLDAFCMGLHMIGKTLVISRKERNAQQMIHGSSNAGYGHNFEKTFTEPDYDMGNSSSHHRVIRYHIGPLDCVVRFEVDAYYEDPDTALGSESIHPSKEPIGTMIAAMTQLDVSGLPPTQGSSRKAPTDKPTRVIEKGVFIDPYKLAEIKAKRLARLNEALPQLWFGRTPYFMNGNHNKGKVHSVSISHAESEFPRWEETNQDKLRKMVSLLTELRDQVALVWERAAVLVHDEKGGPLKVYAMKKNGGVLPADIISKHWSVK
ncbi:hypothetical protein G6011_10728 [Alternaria panax]|uniref:Geranylgeranyl pyrophosphate synthetase n=1 Tax=Alternaria panax TaxID=48097 RepID=A0AAD4NR48_9PLEO|nr:hypothetical protein G6011_10728 [Alternaria panax]